MSPRLPYTPLTSHQLCSGDYFIINQVFQRWGLQTSSTQEQLVRAAELIAAICCRHDPGVLHLRGIARQSLRRRAEREEREGL